MNARDAAARRPAAVRRCQGHGRAGARARGLEPVTNKLLGPTVSDADAAEAGVRSFEREADALISRQRTRGAQKIVRARRSCVVALLVWAGARAGRRGDARRCARDSVAPAAGGAVARRRRGGRRSWCAKARWSRPGSCCCAWTRPAPAPACARARRRASRCAPARRGCARWPKARRSSRRRAATTTRRRRGVDERAPLYEAARQRAGRHAVGQSAAARAAAAGAERDAGRAQPPRSAALELTQQELTQTRPLLATGAVSQVDILRLEREVSTLPRRGRAGRAQIARVQAAIGEAQRKVAGDRAHVPQRGAARNWPR